MKANGFLDGGHSSAGSRILTQGSTSVKRDDLQSILDWAQGLKAKNLRKRSRQRGTGLVNYGQSV
jgi:hypothetical protein